MVAKTEEEIEAVEIYLSDIQDISHKFDFVAKHGSEKQIFRFMKTLETGLSRKSEDLEKLISSLTLPQLLFKESMIENIGSVITLNQSLKTSLSSIQKYHLHANMKFI
jgi:hypothetical protein